MFSDEKDLQGFCASANGDLLCVMATAREPGELYLNGQKLTDHNGWLREYPQGKLEEFWIKSRDGKADLQYFLLHPVNEEPGKLYPAVLDIKGGPTTMYDKGYWHEFHALSAAGFAVIYGNPRGSVGFGQSFCDGPVCWQMEPVNDLEDMLLDAISKGLIDEKRVGVTGGSYGGYMTNYIATHAQRFQAYVTQRSVVSDMIDYACSDMQGSSRKYASFEEFMVNSLKNSPVSYVERINKPFLILHGMDDYRTPVEGAHQLFVAVKDTHPDLPVKMVLFPHTNHDQPRDPRLLKTYYQEMVTWFKTYL